MPVLRAAIIPPEFVHGFTTRDVDRAALFAPNGLRLYRAHQVHRADVVEVRGDEEPAAVAGAAADVLCARAAGVVVAVRTADCVPILLCAPGVGACAAVHAGWRGTVAGAVGAGVAALRRHGAAPQDIHAAIGPAICGPCYEVGDDVAARVAAVEPAAVTRDAAGRAHADLQRCNRSALLAAGVPAAQIEILDACTRCDEDGRFHSFRRDGEVRGEQLAFIGRR